MTGIGISEVNNKGKQLQLNGRQMGVGATGNPLVGFDTIAGNILLGSTNYVQLGTNRYIRAVRACKYVAEPGMADLHEQPSCDDWARG